jgi:type I restriction enzyme S subunit
MKGRSKSRPKLLGEVVRFGNGKSIKPGTEGRYAVYGSNGIIGGYDEFRHENGVIIGRVGAYCGAVVYCPDRFWASDNTLVAYPANDQVDTRFLYYLLLEAKLGQHAGGAAQPLVTQTILKQVEVEIPDLPTQRKIAGILSAYDDLIENNLRRIKILEEMAQSLYREWFVHFRFPGHESAKFVDSELGLIPKGWEVKAIEEVAIVHRGRSYRSSELLDDGGLPFINLKCVVRDGGFRRDGIKRFDGPYKDSHKVVPGDIVMAVTDMTQERRIVARAARIPTLDADFGIVSMDLVKIEPRLGVSSDYLYGYFRCSDFADHLKQHANGANVLHLSPDRIKEHHFVMPDGQLRNRYSVTAGLHFERIENLHRRNDILRRTRDLLLPKLLSP